jgi:hypothetical protein
VYVPAEPTSAESPRVQQQQQQQQHKSAAPASARPAWALTEQGVEDAEDEELNDLLEFTEALDFDSYIDDMEVREAVKVVKQRVSEINKQIVANAKKQAALQRAQEYAATHGTVEEAAGEAASVPAFKKHEPAKDVGDGWNGSTNTNAAQQQQQASAEENAVDAVLADTRIRQVHSRQSARALAETTKQEVKQQKKKIASLPAYASKNTTLGLAIPNPHIAVTHQHGNELTQTGKPVRASNLPFLYRHPGI